MPNVNAVLAQEITRLSKKTVNSGTKVTRKLVAQHRRDIAALKRQIAALTKRLAFVEKRQPKEIAPPPEVLEKARFRAMGVKAHRAKLGLSAALYGKLVGVSPLTIYQWESGKTIPRQTQKAKWLAIRGLGKKEAMERLGGGAPKSDAAQPAPRRVRGNYDQTAEEFITALVKSRKAITTGEINAAWKKSGRPGKADNTLSLMVAGRRLKRVKMKGVRGSRYTTS